MCESLEVPDLLLLMPLPPLLAVDVPHPPIQGVYTYTYCPCVLSSMCTLCMWDTQQQIFILLLVAIDHGDFECFQWNVSMS